MSKLNENAQKWVAALRSGKYEQTSGYLHDEHGYCCLGVACELAIKDGVVVEVEDDRDEGGFFRYDNAYELPPPPVQAWLGLSTENGEFGDSPNSPNDSLADRNDAGATFAQIADLIEEHADELGVAA